MLSPLPFLWHILSSEWSQDSHSWLGCGIGAGSVVLLVGSWVAGMPDPSARQ